MVSVNLRLTIAPVMRTEGEVGMSDNKTEMKIYKRLIKPMMLVPTSSNDYSPKQVQIEPEEKWYPEENRETLVQKYKYLETAFETLVFEDKYEEIKIPEIVRCKDCKYRDPTELDSHKERR